MQAVSKGCEEGMTADDSKKLKFYKMQTEQVLNRVLSHIFEVMVRQRIISLDTWRF
jgi:hypothetical protein